MNLCIIDYNDSILCNRKISNIHTKHKKSYVTKKEFPENVCAECYAILLLKTGKEVMWNSLFDVYMCPPGYMVIYD